jgi:hypothetical protein
MSLLLIACMPTAFSLSPHRPVGEGRVRGAAEPVRSVTRLTLPSLRDGPLPLPPEGRRGHPGAASG